MTQPTQYRYWGAVKPPEGREPIRAQVAAKPSGDGKSATIRLYDPIDSYGGDWGVSAKEFGALLDALSDDVTTIDLFVNSPGGDVFDGMTIMNQLRSHKAAVNVTVEGIAASIASVIIQAGDTITMAPGATAMVHDASGLAIGNARDMKQMAGVLDTLSSSIADVYAARAGGTADEWRSVMGKETWFTADEAVTARLADTLTPSPTKPAVGPKASFDLSMFAYAGREESPAPFMPTNTPAHQPVTPSTETQEADMSDTLLEGLRMQLGLTADADEATVLAANAEALKEAADPPPAAPAAELVIPEGKTLVSQNVLDELRTMAQAGVQARAKQLGEERDEAISAAFTAGKISADRRVAWTASWDKDPEGTKADLESLPARFPVAKTTGYQGHDATPTATFTDDEADMLGALAGLPKGALR